MEKNKPEDRAPGYYWVRTFQGEWVVAEHVGNGWWGMTFSYDGIEENDGSILEVGEKIERQGV